MSGNDGTDGSYWFLKVCMDISHQTDCLSTFLSPFECKKEPLSETGDHDEASSREPQALCTAAAASQVCGQRLSWATIGTTMSAPHTTFTTMNVNYRPNYNYRPRGSTICVPIKAGLLGKAAKGAASAA